jgi:hypothetical protein
VTSIERTAYPRFKRFLSARELHVFYTPQPEEIAWARGQARSDEHLLALMVQVKCFSRMGYFPRLEDGDREKPWEVRKRRPFAEQPGGPRHCRSG